jgi:transcription initiation factor TFIIB
MQEEIARLYRKLSNEGFVTGRSIAGVAAACTYLVARKENIPRQIPEIAEAYQIDEKELSRLIRHISRKFNMHTITSPSEYFDRFISELELPPNTRLQVDHLWQVIEPHSDIWQGKKPMGVAAALIYKAAKESGRARTQADICKISNISEVTLRGLLKLINGLLHRLGEASHN